MTRQLDLVLNVIAYDGRAPTQALGARCAGETCVLGRHPTCQLELPDPESQISGRHALVERCGDGFSLTDISTNGTFLNDVETPLEPNQRVNLHDGDRLHIGPYTIAVAFATAAGASHLEPPAPKPRQASEAVPGVRSSADILELIGAGPDTPAAPPPTHRHLDRPDDQSRCAPKPAEPSRPPAAREAKRVTSASQLHAAPPPRPADALAAQPSRDSGVAPHEPSSRSPTPDPADAATALAGTGDWETSGEATGSAVNDPARACRNPAGDSRASPDAGTSIAPRPDLSLREESAVVATDPSPEAADGVNACRAIPQAGIGDATRVRAEVDVRNDVDKEEPSANASAQAAELKAFLSGLGTGDLAEIRDPEHVLRASGELLRAMTHGLMAVMMARASFKSELRLGVTTIRASDNNPFQFCADPEDALERLLWRPSRGFLEPATAARKAFDDVQEHHMALMAGLRGVLQALLARLEPHGIKQEADRQAGLDRLLPNARKAKCWDLFVAAFDEIADDVSEDFMQLFGDAFNRAYDDQVERLSKARSRD